MARDRPEVPALYPRLLGEAFSALPPVLRRFHGRVAGGTARGVFQVTRGKGRLRSKLADLMRLPACGRHVPVRLRVVVEGDRERWVREFSDRRIETVQRACGGLLVEAIGPMRFGFRLLPRPGGLQFELARSWLYMFPLPLALAPRIAAAATARGESWEIDARVDLPLIGLILRYEGKVRPE